MGVDIQQGKTRTLRLVPHAPMSGPTCRIVDRKAALLASPTATPHAGTTTVATDADNSAQRFKLTSSAGFAIGDTIRVADASWGTAPAVLSSVDGAYVRTVEPLPATPRDGAAVVGLDVLVQVPAQATADLALDNIVIVEAGEEEVTELFNVVVHPYRGPVTARIVRDYMSRMYQGETTEDETWWQRVADETNARIRGRLLESSRYISRYWDPDALREIGSVMMKLVLADYGYWTSDGDRDDYLRSLRIELKERVGGILKGGEPYDEDGDGTIDDDELDGWTTIRGVR